MPKYLKCVEGRVKKEEGKIEIPSNEHVAAAGEEIEEFISQEIIRAFKACGVDVNIAGDRPLSFAHELENKKIRIDNLMFPTEPFKDGLYFYKNNKFVTFVFVPREEGIDAVNDFGDRL